MAQVKAVDKMTSIGWLPQRTGEEDTTATGIQQRKIVYFVINLAATIHDSNSKEKLC